MGEPRDPAADHLLADALIDDAKDRLTAATPLRIKDLDRLEVATLLRNQGVCRADIAEVIGVRPWEVRQVLAGKVVP